MTADGRGGGDLRLEVVEDIHDVPESIWDAILDPDDLQATHRFVRTCQESGVEDATYRHVVVTDEAGTAAIATLCSLGVRLDLLAPAAIRRPLTALRRLMPGLLSFDMAVCGLPVSFNQSCLRVRSGVAVDAVVPLIEAETARFAEEVGARIRCYKELSTEEHQAVGAEVERSGYLKAYSLPSCHIDLPWENFEEYLAAMRAGYRRQLSATLRLRDEHGLRVRSVPDVGSMVDEIAPLYDQVMDRAEHQLERLNRAFFERLAANLPEAHGLILQDAEGRPLAGAVLLRGPTRSTFLIAGIDYARNRRHSAYENLVTAVVKQAIEWGSCSLEMGQTSLPLKTRLGATPADRWLYLRHANPTWQRILSAGGPLLFPRATVPARRVFRTGRR
ncbi:MAG TPA: GNAT family N-acetyltransferase [Longimicrobiales bacterium]|nr:GNAT family N-acetyltransferase [Longimicrobiales bacterium]